MLMMNSYLMNRFLSKSSTAWMMMSLRAALLSTLIMIVVFLTLTLNVPMLHQHHHHLIGVLNQTLALKESGSEPGVHIFPSDICSIKSRACSVTMDFALFMALYGLVVAFVTSMTMWCCCVRAATPKLVWQKETHDESQGSVPKSCQSQGLVPKSKSQGLVPKSKSKGSVESNGLDLNLSQIIVTETGKKFHITCHCRHLEENHTFRALWCPKCVSQTDKVDYTFSTALFCCRSGDSFTLHFDPNCDDTSSPRTLCKTCWKSLLNVAGSSLSGCQLLMLGSPNLIEHLLKH